MNRIRMTIAVAFVLSVAVAQTQAPLLKLRLRLDKSTFHLNDKVAVTTEFTNTSPDTVCFPPPDLECSSPETGWMTVTAHSTADEDDRFICQFDGNGAIGAKLDSEVRTKWIKVPPQKSYELVARNVVLDKLGQWHLAATYHSPEGSFSKAYKRLLQSAANKAGCTLPDSATNAEPVLITVTE